MNPILQKGLKCKCGSPKLKQWARCNGCERSIRKEKVDKTKKLRKEREKRKRSIIAHYKKTDSYSKTGKEFGISRMAVWLAVGNNRRGKPLTQKQRQEILLRDNFRCKNCKNKYNLEIHHKDGNSHNNEKQNLETLCKNCHKNKH